VDLRIRAGRNLDAVLHCIALNVRSSHCSAPSFGYERPTKIRSPVRPRRRGLRRDGRNENRYLAQPREPDTGRIRRETRGIIDRDSLARRAKRGYNRITWRICEKGGRRPIRSFGCSPGRPLPLSIISLVSSWAAAGGAGSAKNNFPFPVPPTRRENPEREREREREERGTEKGRVYHRFNPLRPSSLSESLPFACNNTVIRVLHLEDRIETVPFPRPPSATPATIRFTPYSRRKSVRQERFSLSTESRNVLTSSTRRHRRRRHRSISERGSRAVLRIHVATSSRIFLLFFSPDSRVSHPVHRCVQLKTRSYVVESPLFESPLANDVRVRG